MPVRARSRVIFVRQNALATHLFDVALAEDTAHSSRPYSFRWIGRAVPCEYSVGVLPELANDGERGRNDRIY